MKILVFTLLGMALMSTLNAETVIYESDKDIRKAKKVYKKKMRRSCGFTGVRFSRSHTLGEWEDIKQNDQFEDEISKLCPRMKNKLKPSWINALYKFTIKYSSDSKIRPDC